MSRRRGFFGLIKVTDDDTLKARGLANRLDDMDMIMSPVDQKLVCVAMKHGVHVCWGCCEPFDPEEKGLRFTEVRLPREHAHQPAEVRVGLHARCVDPSKRPIFSDMGSDRKLQSVEEVTKGLRLRRTVARAVKPFVDAAQANVAKIIA